MGITTADIRKIRADVQRLQGDLAGHIGHAESEYTSVRQQLEELKERVNDINEDMETEAMKPIQALQLWRAEVTGGWRASMIFGQVVGTLVGGIVVGVVTFLITRHT